MQEIKYFELFSGIGSPRAALERIAKDTGKIKPISLGYSEIDKRAIEQYEFLYNDFNNYGDITKIKELPVGTDLLTSGTPCQGFSTAGLGLGGDEGSGTKSSLMWEHMRLVSKSKPKIVVWENVTGVLSEKHKHNFDKYLNTMEKLGYKNTCKIINALDCGIPQNRERIFVISFLNHGDFVNLDNIKKRKTKNINDIIDFDNLPDVPPSKSKNSTSSFARTIYKKSLYNNDTTPRFSISEQQKFCPTLTRRNIAKKNGNKWCYVTPKERYLLSGFTEEQYKKVEHCSVSAICSTTGNTIVVDVLDVIFRLIYLGEEKETAIQTELF